MKLSAQAALSLAQWLVPVASWVVGYFSAVLLDRRRRRRRLHAVAQVLLIDLNRIGDELPKQSSRMEDAFGKLTFAVPEIHPWAQSNIVEAVDIDPPVVAGFMKLERELTNLRQLLLHLRLAKTNYLEVKELEEAYQKAEYEARARREDVSGLLSRAPRARVNEAQQEADSLLDFCSMELGSARETIRDLQDRLQQYDSAQPKFVRQLKLLIRGLHK